MSHRETMNRPMSHSHSLHHRDVVNHAAMIDRSIPHGQIQCELASMQASIAHHHEGDLTDIRPWMTQHVLSHRQMA
jgi:hypothetical protein